MSSRSSPLSSPYSSPRPGASSTLNTQEPVRPDRADSPQSSSSSLSNPDAAEMPPSSPPGSDIGEEEGEGGSETTATIPLGSDVGSDSELTDEEEEAGQEVMSAVPATLDDIASMTETNNAEERRNGGTTISAQNSSRISPQLPADITPRASEAKPKQGVSSRSPSLTPPPPNLAQRSRTTASPVTSLGLGKRKRGSSVDNVAGLTNGAEVAGPSGQTGPVNGDVTPNGGGEADSAVDHPYQEVEDEDIPLPENIQGPDAEQAFLEAMDAFDEQDFGVSSAGQGVTAQPEGEEVDNSQGDPVDVQADFEMQEEEVPAQVEYAEDEVDITEQSQGVNGVEANGEDSSREVAAELPSEDVAGPSTEIDETAENTEVPQDQILTEESAPQAEEAEEELQATPVIPPVPVHHSSHAPPPSQTAMREMLKLEVKFAALRDRLYIERMEEAAEEEEMILNGTHPALQQLHKTLSHRRERLHELASQRHEEAMKELNVVRKAEGAAVWSWWTDERDRMHWREFEQTWSKRRRLAREKNEIESVRYAKPVPYVGDPRFSKGFDWSVGPSPARLSADEGNHDLALMDHRQTQLSRHASPARGATFPPLPNFPMGHPQQSGQSNQQRAEPFAPYSAGQTYAEAAHAGGPMTATASGYGDSPRIPSSGHPRSRVSTPGAGPSTLNRPQATHAPSYGGAGLMDHLAYPRNATALGPTSSGSLSSFFQGPSSQTQTQSQSQQQQRREGRTVPTASTMFGPNSPVTQSFPFNQAQNSNGMTKEVKQENIEHGPWGSRVHMPMGFGLGFGMGGGSTNGMSGFGTLGSKEGATPSQPLVVAGQPPSYAASMTAAGRDGGEEGGTAQVGSIGASRTPTPIAVNGVGGHEAEPPGVVNPVNIEVDTNKAENGHKPNGDATNTSGPTEVSQTITVGSPDEVTPGAINGDPKTQQSLVDLKRDISVEMDRQVERENERVKEKPRYPGLADYLGGSNPPLNMGLGKMGRALSPARSGVSRSPFSAPPVPAPAPQALSRI